MVTTLTLDFYVENQATAGRPVREAAAEKGSEPNQPQNTNLAKTLAVTLSFWPGLLDTCPRPTP
jgi:hypothetical protein